MRKLNLFKNTKGAAAIEMAIVLPVLVLIIAAVLEFGFYFLKEQAASRAVSTASIAVQQRQDDVTVFANMKKSGLSMMDFSASPNFVCAKAYTTYDLANAGSCVAADGFVTSAPTGVAAGTPYYVAVRAYAVHTPITPLRNLSGSFPPDIDQRNVVPVNSGSSGWVDVPLTDSNAFDSSCEYRFRLNTNGFSAWGMTQTTNNNWWYANMVDTYRMVFVLDGCHITYIKSSQKSHEYYLDCYGGGYDMISQGYSVTNIQKKCN